MIRSYEEYLQERKPDTTSNQVRNAYHIWTTEWNNMDKPFVINLFSLTIASALSNGVVPQIIYHSTKNYGNEVSVYGKSCIFLMNVCRIEFNGSCWSFN